MLQEAPQCIRDGRTIATGKEETFGSRGLSLCNTSTFTPTKVQFENKDNGDTEMLDIETGKLVRVRLVVQ